MSSSLDALIEYIPFIPDVVEEAPVSWFLIKPLSPFKIEICLLGGSFLGQIKPSASVVVLKLKILFALEK